MVVLNDRCIPRTLDAYPNFPITPSVHNSVIHDYGVGSLARFQNPSSVISIHDRPDFHSLSHLEIRQRLDAEGHNNSQIVIIDSDTAANHAVWYVLTTAESEFLTELEGDIGLSPKEYPGEMTLWKLHLLTQQVPIQHDFHDAGKPFWEDIEEPYDPHDPQIPPLSGPDYNTKEAAMSNAWFSFPRITASPGEYEFNDDPDPRFFPFHPRYVVRLTREAARGAGLLSEWDDWDKPLPDAGANISFKAHYDWDSPKWAWDGHTQGNATASGRSIANKGLLRMGCMAQTMNLTGVDHRLPLMRNGRMLNGSVLTTA